jgi:hypothetical protein
MALRRLASGSSVSLSLCAPCSKSFPACKLLFVRHTDRNSLRGLHRASSGLSRQRDLTVNSPPPGQCVPWLVQRANHQFSYSPRDRKPSSPSQRGFSFREQQVSRHCTFTRSSTSNPRISAKLAVTGPRVRCPRCRCRWRRSPCCFRFGRGRVQHSLYL